MGRVIRNGLGGVGVVATLLGGLALVAPTFVAETEPFASVVGAASAVDMRTLLVLGSVAATLYLVAATWHSPETRLPAGDGSVSDRFARTLVDPPESVSAPDETLAASEFDAAIDRAVDGDERAMERVRDRLQRLAVARLTREPGPTEGPMTTDQARRAVAAGTWTETRTAAAFCADATGPTASLWSRLRLWLDPATERERRIRETVAAIDSLADDRGPEGGAGESPGSEGETNVSTDRPATAAVEPGESGAGGVGR